MSQSSNLYRLQMADSQLDQIHKRINEIDIILSQDEELQKAQDGLNSTTLNISDLQKSLRKTEETVQALKIKIEQTEAMLYSGKVRNPKELQDLQAESAALKRHLVILEDHELDAMVKLEDAEQEGQMAKAELDNVQSKLASQFSLLTGERLALNQEIQRLETEREAAIRMTGVEELAIYEELRKQRRGIAVSKVVDKSCSACGSSLPPALIQQAINSPTLVRCPTCGRIIYPG